MNRYSVHQPTPAALYDVDYSFYLQRGRQEQARAMREMFAGLVRWCRQRLPGNADNRRAGQPPALAEAVSHCS